MIRRKGRTRRFLAAAAVAVSISLGASAALFSTCGPFTDVAADVFCPFVLEVFYVGITTGTTATTYDPSSPVSRLQMATFLSRGVDAVLLRGSRRAALGQFWKRGSNAFLEINLDTNTVGTAMAVSDGTDVFVSNTVNGKVFRVRNDGKVLETTTGAAGAYGLVSAGGKIWVTSTPGNGDLYSIQPSVGAGFFGWYAFTGANPTDITFDGTSIWTANLSGSVSRFNPATPAFSMVTTGFVSPFGILFDGSNVWVTDIGLNKLQKLDGNAAILQTVTVGSSPRFPMFDGANIWVPNFLSNSVSIVHASTGAVVSTLTGNGLNGPVAAAFDGERAMVTNYSGDSLSLWKAADLTTIGTVTLPPGSAPNGACSDGVNFWVALYGRGTLLRF